MEYIPNWTEYMNYLSPIYLDQYSKAYAEIKDEAPDSESFGFTVDTLPLDIEE